MTCSVSCASAILRSSCADTGVKPNRPAINTKMLGFNLSIPEFPLALQISREPPSGQAIVRSDGFDLLHVFAVSLRLIPQRSERKIHLKRKQPEEIPSQLFLIETACATRTSLSLWMW